MNNFGWAGAPNPPGSPARLGHPTLAKECHGWLDVWSGRLAHPAAQPGCVTEEDMRSCRKHFRPILRGSMHAHPAIVSGRLVSRANVRPDVCLWPCTPYTPSTPHVPQQSISPSRGEAGGSLRSRGLSECRVLARLEASPVTRLLGMERGPQGPPPSPWF